MNNYNLLFYDFECFKYDWLVVLIDYNTRKKQVIINNKKALYNFYNKATANNYIWVGYNSRNYDSILLKGILLGKNAWEINDMIINKGMKEFQILGKDRETIPLINFDISNKFNSLKQFEGFMGSMIKESSIDFTIDRKLTNDEIKETIKYCTHDVEQTIEVFNNKKEEFDSQSALIDTFNLPLEDFNRTKAQLVATILKAERKEYNDEFDIIYPKNAQLGKYSYILDWFKDPKNHDTSKSLYTTIAGIPHVVAWGGLHGSKDNYIYHGKMMCADVASLYPSIMIEYNLLSRSVKEPELYREIRDTRLKLKKEHNPMQKPYKIVLNSTYGASGDKHNPLYDPRMCRCVCVTGQLLIIDLIEKVEPYCNLIQSNTDGIYLFFDDENNIPIVESIMHDWEKRSRLSLEIDMADGIIQKDVNNYILIEGTDIKSKGAYVKSLNKVDYNLPILNKALINYFIKNESIEDTINNCNDLIEYQMIVKIGSTYDYGLYGDEKLRERVLRIFATTDQTAKGVYKVKIGSNPAKLPDTPEHCKIYNEDVNGLKIFDDLDKQFYIDMAKKRLDDFLTKKDKSKIKNEIKGVSNEIKNDIQEINKTHKYSNFYELLSHISDFNCNNSQLCILIKLGYLSNYGDIELLLTFIKWYNILGKIKNLSISKINKYNIDKNIIEKHCESHTEKTYKNINSKKIIYELCMPMINHKTELYKQAMWEMYYTNYTNIIDSSCDSDIYIVQSLDVNNYGTAFAILYQCCSGQVTQSYKIDRKWYAENPCQVADIIRVAFKDKFKHVKVDDKWVESNDVETIISNYFIMERVE